MPPDTADKPCHTCRRRRLRCDRSLPSCRKCLKGGRECLGYQKCIIWANGVASRGKMMGRSYDPPAQDELQPHNAQTRLDRVRNNANGKLTSLNLDSHHSFVAQTFSSVPGQTLLVPVSTTKRLAPGTTALTRPLTDPLLQDLDSSLRHYISYFSTNFSKLFCIHDRVPSNNPMRECIPLMQENPVLLYAIAATSAYHICNTENEPNITGLEPQTSSSVIRVASSIWRDTSDLIHYTNALIYKERALQLLITALGNSNRGNDDAALAAIYFLANFELLETGRDHWKIHLDGAKRIIGLLGSETGDLSNMASGPLRSYVIANCLSYDILGSALAAQKVQNPLAYKSQDVLAVLKGAESILFTSCPTDLLQIIITVSELSNKDENRSSCPFQRTLDRQREQEVLLKLAAFNPWSWARALQMNISTNEIDGRAHVGSAYKSAVNIYIRRALLLEMPNSSASEDASSIMHHLSYIPPDNDLFIATVWPTFFAGAEAKGDKERRWVVDHLNAIYAQVMFFNIRNAVEVLNLIWQASDDKDRDFNWIQELDSLGSSWLFI